MHIGQRIESQQTKTKSRLLGGYCKNTGLQNEGRAKEASMKVMGVENQHEHPPGLEIYGIRDRKESSVTPLNVSF